MGVKFHSDIQTWELLKEKTPSFWVPKHVEKETTSGASLPVKQAWNHKKDHFLVSLKENGK